MSLRAASTAVVAGLVLAVAASPASARSGFCSSSGDVCYSAQKRSDNVHLLLTLQAKYFPSYTLCVKAPTGASECHKFKVLKTGTVFGSTVRWSKHFRVHGPGKYTATWKTSSGKLGPSVTFHP